MVGFLAKEPSASWRPFTTWITVWGVQSCLQNVFRVIDVVCPETEFGSSFPDKFVRVQESRGNFSFEVKEMRVVRDILFEKVLTFSASYLRRTRELQVVSLPRKLECKKEARGGSLRFTYSFDILDWSLVWFPNVFLRFEEDVVHVEEREK